MRQTIAVGGLKEFSKGLRKLDSDLPKALRIAMNAAAGLVIDYAVPRIPRRSGRAASTLKAKSTRTAARIAMGGKRAPYMPWLDFGGKVGPNRSVSRPFLKDGRFVYKGLAERREQITDVMERGIRDVARQAGLEVD
ncbi:HK97 gp10 family phage protein [Micromonospora sp. HUAS LYJ1]|uniref:HK97 gp10 family phage protein n=1 Tax=Micromonospora sp. HUAS LYJ1 TaxID=3061626 RepID=UPI002670F1FB|nr:HK97 gp10 family phage protein [Micromonospora sp. HUAS LYJ1]WKU03847.1 HK97 gp10 family phage protein [Micromonospora sp. HUAS LYJ1]